MTDVRSVYPGFGLGEIIKKKVGKWITIGFFLYFFIVVKDRIN